MIIKKKKGNMKIPTHTILSTIKLSFLPPLYFSITVISDSSWSNNMGKFKVNFSEVYFFKKHVLNTLLCHL